MVLRSLFGLEPFGKLFLVPVADHATSVSCGAAQQMWLTCYMLLQREGETLYCGLGHYSLPLSAVPA
jgi:hypothetical protein